MCCLPGSVSTGIRSLIEVGSPVGPLVLSVLYLPDTRLRGTTSIVFGENQLSPSLIGLSPLPRAHRNIFQHEPVRSSTRCYPSFNLALGRSLRFRVYPHRLSVALFRLAFAAAPVQNTLTSPMRSNSPDHNAKGTQSQERVCSRTHTPAPTACRHTVSGSVSLAARRAFHLSLTVLVRYRSRTRM